MADPIVHPPTSATADFVPAWRQPDWRRDPEDVLDARLDELRCLASCVTVLSAADRCSEVRHELIDDALPTLGHVMMRLAMEAIRAKQEIERNAAKPTRGGLQ